MLKHSPTLDLVFHALADGTRRSMVERLIRGPVSVGELAKPLQMTLSAVSQHLKVLEHSGLVRTRKVGRVKTCSIDSKALGTAQDWIAERRAMLERRVDRLEAFLKREAKP